MDAREIAFPDASFDHVGRHAHHVRRARARAGAGRNGPRCPPRRVGDDRQPLRGRAEGWTFAERLAAPLANLLGWHSDFAMDRVLGHPQLRLVDQRQVKPFGLMTFLRFRRVEG